MSKYGDDEDDSYEAVNEAVEEENTDLLTTEEETELEDGLTEPRRESMLDVFRRQISEVFDLSEEQVAEFKVREELVSLYDSPTRRERLGYQWVPTETELKKRAPKWAREVQCPKCGAIMTPLKVKGVSRRYGENITYQCHRVDINREICLTLVQVYDGVWHFMRPGDFTPGIWGWEGVADETVAVIPGTKILDAAPEADFIKPHVIPPNPWSKGKTSSRVIWNVFWTTIMEDGEIGHKELIEKVQEIRPQDKRAGRTRTKLYRDVDNIESWMQRRTGYVVKQFGQVFRVVGRSRGDHGMYPYSSEQYRKEHGFE